jgi:hypothetical protein
MAFNWETQMERPFVRPRHRRVDNIKTDLQETGWQTWIRLIWLRTGTCGRLLKHGKPLGLIKCGEIVS